MQVNEKKYLLADICLVGHSFGGRAIFSFLQEFPEMAQKLVRGVVIIDISPKSMKQSSNNIEELLRSMQQMQMQGRTRREIEEEVRMQLKSPESLSFIMQNLELENEERDFAFKYSARKLDWRWRLGLEGILKSYEENLQMEFRCRFPGRRALVVCGGNSEFVKKEQIRDFRQVFPDIDLVEDVHFLADAGHMVHAQQPHEVMKLLKRFLERISH